MPGEKKGKKMKKRCGQKGKGMVLYTSCQQDNTPEKEKLGKKLKKLLKKVLTKRWQRDIITKSHESDEKDLEN